ncbi:SCO2322 family protein [Kitasatospora sp. NPDC093550]|uniref:SCO2322 family protein n=1 Tax=Kitasatospora sp. NPDC093550 TaxID=3364089 RepID=UPI0038195586
MPPTPHPRAARPSSTGTGGPAAPVTPAAGAARGRPRRASGPVATTARRPHRASAVASGAVGRPAVPAPRGRLAGLLVPLVGVLLVVAGAAPAEAAGYRYWSFWRGAEGGSWAYQQQGPAIAVPPDGAVDGWRFAVSPDGGQDAAKPRTAGSFADICARTPAQEGRKRVAVVLDFGTAEDAGATGATVPGPRTACAAVAPRATSAEVLAAVAPPLRYDSNGLLCAIAGYPSAGCADQVGAAGGAAAPGAAATSADHGGGPDIGLIAGGALVAVLAGGAVRQARRRRTP